MTVTIRKPVKRRPQFHPLRVSTVDRLTDDAVAVEFAVPDELRPAFAFRAGQHLTVRRLVDGEDVRRSYSICSTPMDLDRGRLRIGVRQVAGGTFSSYATHALQPGDTVEVLPPLGHFVTDLDPGRRRHYAAIVGGSGITPVLSLVATALAVEPGSRFTVKNPPQFSTNSRTARDKRKNGSSMAGDSRHLIGLCLPERGGFAGADRRACFFWS